MDFRNVFSAVPHITAISVSQKALEGWQGRNCQREQFSSGSGHQEPAKYKQKCEIFTRFISLNYANAQNPPIAQDLKNKFYEFGPCRDFLHVCIVQDKSMRCCLAPQASDLCCWSLSKCRGDCRACWLRPHAPPASSGAGRELRYTSRVVSLSHASEGKYQIVRHSPVSALLLG